MTTVLLTYLPERKDRPCPDAALERALLKGWIADTALDGRREPDDLPNMCLAAMLNVVMALLAAFFSFMPAVGRVTLRRSR